MGEGYQTADSVRGASGRYGAADERSGRVLGAGLWRTGESQVFIQHSGAAVFAALLLDCDKLDTSLSHPVSTCLPILSKRQARLPEIMAKKSDSDRGS